MSGLDKCNDCVVNRYSVKNVLFATFFQDSQCKSSHRVHNFIYSYQVCFKFRMGITYEYFENVSTAEYRIFNERFIKWTCIKMCVTAEVNIPLVSVVGV